MHYDKIFICCKNSKSFYTILFDKFQLSQNSGLDYYASPRAKGAMCQRMQTLRTVILRDTLSASSWALTDADACTCIASSIKLWRRSANARMRYPLEMLDSGRICNMFLILIRPINSSVGRAHLRPPANCWIYAKCPPISETIHTSLGRRESCSD